MEDAKLQALHDTLSQIRGKKGLGTNSQFSWQRGTGATQSESARHPAAAHLPDNALYAHFLPEGVYDPNSKAIDYGDGRIVKRDFSDAIMGDSDNDEDSNRKTKKRKTKFDKEEKMRQKEIRKAEKKAAKKAEKLKAKREAKLEEKKRQKKLEKKLKKDQLSGEDSRNKTTAADKDTQHTLTDEAEKSTPKVKSKKEKIEIVSVDNDMEHDTKKGAKKRKKQRDNV